MKLMMKKEPNGFHAKRKSFAAILVEEKVTTQEEVNTAFESSLKSDIPIGEYLVMEKRLSKKSLDHILQKRKIDILLGDLLLETGVVEKPSLIADAVKRQEGRGEKLGDILQSYGIIDHDNLMGALCQQLDILTITPELELAHDITPMPSTAYMEKNLIVPYMKVDDVVTIVMNDPLDIRIREDMEAFYKGQVIVYAYANKDDFAGFFGKRRAWKEEYNYDESDAAFNSDMQILEPVLTSETELVGSGDSVKIFEFYLKKAIALGASDIHFEPLQRSLRVRFAIDGVLRTITQLPLSLGPRILGMLKAHSGIDTTKSHLPSDGRLTVTYKEGEFGLRISTYPSLFGENCVLRIIRTDTSFASIDSLGFSKSNLRLIKKSLASASGVVLVTGPTGSGKTTTLYTALRQITQEQSQHVITIEDPIEYTLHGATQGTLNEKLGLDYPTALSAIMRQNPDVIMVGEIRDSKTAKAITQAALTGHKVFTTFHTETAIGALIRLHEMGIENYLINETVELIIAQRLVRKVCNRCKETYTPSKKTLEALEIPADVCETKSVYRGSGLVGDDRCPVCHGSGYKGQIAIHEVLFVNKDVSDAIEKNKTSREILEVAKQRASFITFKEDAVNKVLQGETTCEEIIRVLPDVAGKIRPLDRIAELCDTGVESPACDHSVAQWGSETLRDIATSDHSNEQSVAEDMQAGEMLAKVGLKLKKVFSAKLGASQQALGSEEFATLMKVWCDTSNHCTGPMEDNPQCEKCKSLESNAVSALARANCDNCDLVVATDDHLAYLLLNDPAHKNSSWKVIASTPISNS